MNVIPEDDFKGSKP
jgi:hypothetical protein